MNKNKYYCTLFAYLIATLLLSNGLFANLSNQQPLLPGVLIFKTAKNISESECMVFSTAILKN